MQPCKAHPYPFYHITFPENLPSIVQQGLKTSYAMEEYSYYIHLDERANYLHQYQSIPKNIAYQRAEQDLQGNPLKPLIFVAKNPRTVDIFEDDPRKIVILGIEPHCQGLFRQRPQLLHKSDEFYTDQEVPPRCLCLVTNWQNIPP